MLLIANKELKKCLTDAHCDIIIGKLLNHVFNILQLLTREWQIKYSHTQEFFVPKIVQTRYYGPLHIMFLHTLSVPKY
jgi:hypothetical protein